MQKPTDYPTDKTLHPNYPFLMSSHGLKSFESDDEDDDSDSSNDQFAFTINTELLVDVKDISIGDFIGEGSSSTVYRGLWVSRFSISYFEIASGFGAKIADFVLLFILS